MLLLPAFASVARAQGQERPFVEEEKRKELEAERYRPEPLQEFVYDFGAWYHFEFLSFDDAPKPDDRTLWFHDLRLWGAVTYHQWLTAFARVKNQYLDWDHGDQFGFHNNAWKPARLDQGYIEARFEPATVRGGRQFQSLGLGTVYNAVADGLTAEGQAGKFDYKGFSLFSVHSANDIDSSRPEAGHSDRWHTGLEGGWQGLPGNRLYALALFQFDFNGDNQPGQNFDYNSQYWGVGIKGSDLKHLEHFFEAVYETGRSAGTGSTQTEAISAWSLRAGLNWTPPAGDFRPALFAEYMFGSGDADRASPTSTVGGNRAGTIDTSFAPFGFVQTGYSLFPKLSNLHVIRAGGEFTPFPMLYYADTLHFGAAGYVYMKDKAAAGISDGRASGNSADVGQAIDVWLNWRVLEDVAFNVRYGVFFPGAAYPTVNDPQHFVSAGMTLVF